MTKRTRKESPGCEFGRRIQYERSDDEPPSIAVATALAQYRGEEVTASSVRLYDYIDPEALDSLFADTHGGNRRSAGTVTFEIDGVTVTVEPRRVEVRPGN